MCSCEDNDGPAFYRVVMTRARKPYRCVECHRPIAAGQIYERRSGKWDLEVRSYKACAACARVCEVFDMLTDEDCRPLFGEIQECVREMIRNDPETIERQFITAFMCPDVSWQPTPAAPLEAIADAGADRGPR